MLYPQGWVECVGCADRSCYDLQQHAKATGVKLVAEKPLPAPKTVDFVDCIPQKGPIGKKFKAAAKGLSEHLTKLSPDEVNSLEQAVNENGSANVELNGTTFEITKDMIQVKKYQKTVHVEELVPSVIEPSFGIGRVMYAIFEHNFRVRKDDEQRTVSVTHISFSFNNIVHLKILTSKYNIFIFNA